MPTRNEVGVTALILAIIALVFYGCFSMSHQEIARREAIERRDACMIWEIKSPSFGTYRTKGRPEIDDLRRGTGNVAGSVTFTNAETGGTTIVTPPYSANYIADQKDCK